MRSNEASQVEKSMGLESKRSLLADRKTHDVIAEA
jgi:hypothetical protein